MKDIDISVEYETRTQDLNTKTDYDVPDDHLTIPELSLPSQDSMSTVGAFNKNAYATKSDNYDDWSPKEEDLTLYEQLVPNKEFKDYLDYPVDNYVLQDLVKELQKYDKRYGIMVDHIETAKDLLQWFVDFKWKRLNLLDHWIRFSDYAKITVNTLNHVKVHTDFPVLITAPTVLHTTPDKSANTPFCVDTTSGAIVETDEAYNAHMRAELGEATVQSLNALNMSCYWCGADWLITNNKYHLTLTGVNEKEPPKQFKFKYAIDNVTGVQYAGEYMIIYLLANYTEHALIFDKDFKLVEDTITRVFNTDIVKLLDPKTLIFRDRYQYYVNNNDGTFSTFPLIDMVTPNNTIVKAYTIVQTELKDPRPVNIVDDGPRINTKYGMQYQLIWSFSTEVSLMTFYDATDVTFDMYSYYNPRKYLTNQDYKEACIPLHGGFRRTQVYPYFIGGPGVTYTNGHWYTRFGSFWNTYWDFFFQY